MVLTLLVAIPGAYAVSRLEFFGRRQISAVFLGVYFFPAILLAIPLFVFFTRIGQRGTLTGLLVVYVAQVAAVSIYMLRNYFDTIPASLEEAAAIDGCTRLQAMRHVSLPLAMPAIVSNALFIFMIAWNEFLFALLFLVEDRDKWTVSLGLSQLAGQHRGPDDRADGRLGDPDAADHRAVLPQRAVAGRRPHRRRREGLTDAHRRTRSERKDEPCPRSSRSSPRARSRSSSAEPQPLLPGSVRVRTWYSGISAGTELTAYRGSNPYLTGTWDPDRRLFLPGSPTFAYPVERLGLLRGGRGRRGGRRRRRAGRSGEVVYGIWGHRSDAVVSAAAVADRVIDRGRTPIRGMLRAGRARSRSTRCWPRTRGSATGSPSSARA